MIPIEWSDLKARREEVKRTYPSIRKVPLLFGTKRELMGEIVGGLSGSVLDVGGARKFLGRLCETAPSITEYKSMDVDTSAEHDYKSLGEIKRTFTNIFVLDVIEHLDLKDGKKLLKECGRVLAPGGNIILTVPNNLHPTAHGGDVTHITSYRYHELGALLLMCGFTGLSISRVSAKNRPGHRLLAWLLRPIMRFMDVDYATGILIKATKAG